MKVLIVEDEAPAARRLTNLLKETNPDIEVVDQLDSVESAVLWFAQNPSPDLVMMDIQLSDGLSFEIFEQTEVKAPVIFTTAYDEYALKAFKVNSIDYLLKPVNQEDLAKALEKYEALRRQGDGTANQAAQIEALLSSLNIRPKHFKHRFLIKIGDKFLTVTTDQIAYFYTEDKGVYLLTLDKHRYPVDHSLDDLEKMLDPEKFYRLNRQYIASIDAVTKLHTYFNGKLKVYLSPDAGHDVVVSREKAAHFKGWLDR